MVFDDRFRMGAFAVITNAENKILMLKATYNEEQWGLPGGALDPAETVHEAVWRECREEIGIEVKILYLSGIYYHQTYDSQACIFRCEIPVDAVIQLSHEHSRYHYFALDELSPVQRWRVEDCLNFDGVVKSAKF